MAKEHIYRSELIWTGNMGSGTNHYKEYERSYHIHFENKVTIEGSSDPSFRGDATKHNPEELFLASISSCHMLWYLHLCSIHQVQVVEYTDHAEGIMIEEKDGSGRFTKVVLRPYVVVTDENMIEKAQELHHISNNMCFIANSLNFKVEHEGIVLVK